MTFSSSSTEHATTDSTPVSSGRLAIDCAFSYRAA
ncbi:MAG: hypothetical protein J07HX64_01123 [halophilic archaeon J07HX64]|nr:MAG: hypothetical protein J07HX64_01123 [halophilic archaeon J07HX64]